MLFRSGEKMSKSKGNVVNPDKYIEEYGSDALRMYLMFGFSYIEGGPWSDDGIKSIAKFLDRVERIVVKAAAATGASNYGAKEKELDYALNYCIKSVTADLAAFSFNTAVARVMELVNAMYKYDADGGQLAFLKQTAVALVKLIAPMVPHVAEELHRILGGDKSVFLESFPICDESKLVRDEAELAVQINSKVRTRLVFPASSTKEQIEKAVLADETVQKLLSGATPKKVIVIPGRLINIVV